jgi:hypothetical protein
LSTSPQQNQKIEASLSTLVLSIASSAAMALGLAPHPTSGKVEKDLDMARFNIDLLAVLEEKTKGNRTSDEERFLTSVLQDLKMKFVQAK